MDGIRSDGSIQGLMWDTARYDTGEDRQSGSSRALRGSAVESVGLLRQPVVLSDIEQIPDSVFTETTCLVSDAGVPRFFTNLAVMQSACINPRYIESDSALPNLIRALLETYISGSVAGVGKSPVRVELKAVVQHVPQAKSIVLDQIREILKKNTDFNVAQKMVTVINDLWSDQLHAGVHRYPLFFDVVIRYSNTDKEDAMFSVKVCQGELFSSSGSHYIGGLDAVNLKEGFGTLHCFDGSNYQGNFHCGFYDGVGKLEFATGGSYEGAFSWGRRNGHGILCFSYDVHFDGTFVEDKREGPGTLTLADGQSYTGFWTGDSVILDDSQQQMCLVYNDEDQIIGIK